MLPPLAFALVSRSLGHRRRHGWGYRTFFRYCVQYTACQRHRLTFDDAVRDLVSYLECSLVGHCSTPFGEDGLVRAEYRHRSTGLEAYT